MQQQSESSKLRFFLAAKKSLSYDKRVLPDRPEKNQFYYGDNFEVIQRYIRDESVDLVYLDPPFNPRQDHNVLFAEKDGSKSSSQMSWRQYSYDSPSHS